MDEALRSQSLFRFPAKKRVSYAWVFENQIKEMMDVRACVMSPSATMSLASFLKARAYKDGSEVIMSPLSWVADYSAILFERMKIRFCSFDENLQVNVGSIKDLMNKNTVLVITPHLMGRGQQSVGEIASLCKEKGIDCIEDIAQSFGVKVGGRYAGSYGIFSFCSLNHHKILSTGDGGFSVINDADLYKKVLHIHDQGCEIVDGKRNVDEATYEKGWSLRVNDMTGAVALAQLARFPVTKYAVLEHYAAFIKVATESFPKINILSMHAGDIPYSALIRSSRRGIAYPSLLDSGWHYIENIPYFKNLVIDAASMRSLEQAKKILSTVYSIGAGFVDKYYSTPEGTYMRDTINPDKIIGTIKNII
ncbi:MAG TPA: DegT/DnrJ/EryC1/StrS family aminotransferase [Bacteroidota bacterium]|nr:DegT/DnrJ/EryC1/StrS family aminotransferase [Bacteroidota bacterium]